jgi:hypothetical protein
MQPLNKPQRVSPDEVRFPRSKRFLITCTKTTLNKSQFQFAYFAGEQYEAYELIPGRDYIVWAAPEQWEAISGSTFLNYFRLDITHFGSLRQVY